MSDRLKELEEIVCHWLSKLKDLKASGFLCKSEEVWLVRAEKVWLARAEKVGVDLDRGLTVTVCSVCWRAACWQGVFLCDDYLDAGTVEKTVSELRQLGRESEHYWTLSREGG